MCIFFYTFAPCIGRIWMRRVREAYAYGVSEVCEWRVRAENRRQSASAKAKNKIKKDNSRILEI